MAALERRTKLVAPGQFVLPDLDGLVQGVYAAPPSHSDLDAAYYDSPELGLARARVSVRHRVGMPGPQWSVKLPVAERGSTLLRRRLVFSGPPETVPAGARDLVRAYLRGRPLKHVVRLRTHRTTIHLCDSEDDRIVEVVDDQVTSYVGNARTGSFHEVELTVISPGHLARRVLRAAVDRLVEAGCRAEAAEPKPVRALAESGLEPSEWTTADVRRGASVAEVLQHDLAVATGRLIRADVGVRIGEDHTELRRLRGALKDVRTSLRLFEPVLDNDWVAAIRPELALLVDRADQACTLEALRYHFDARAELALNADDALGVALLLTRVEDEYEAELDELLGAMRTRQYDHFLDGLVDGLRKPPIADIAADDAQGVATRFVEQAVRRRHKKLRRDLRELGPDPGDELLQKLGKRLSRFRAYAAVAHRLHAPEHPAQAELVADVRAAHVLSRDYRESVHASDWLSTAVKDTDADVAATAGKLLAVERFRQAELRDLLCAGLRHIGREA